MLQKRERLAKTRDFQNVFKEGRSIRGQGIVLKLRQREAQGNRFAIVVSKKVAQKAVKRNRIRRLLSEAIRTTMQHIESAPQGIDAILIVLPEFKAQNLKEAKDIVAQLFHKAFILKPQ